MLKKSYLIFKIFLISLFLWNCSNDPVFKDLDTSGIFIDTLSIDSITAFNYKTIPNLGSEPNLYLGGRNGITAPYTLIGIDSLGRFTSSIGIKWEAFLDSSITFNRIDSIFFKVFSVDSGISEQMLPSLYFSSTFDFDEDSVTNSILDGNFVSPDWTLIGLPLVKTNYDTIGNYSSTQLIWNLNQFLDHLITDQDSSVNIIRTFALLNNQVDNYVTLMSRESSTGTTDPQIKVFYRQNIVYDQDSVLTDTSLNATFYAHKDVSVIIDENYNFDTPYIGLNNGLGLQSIMHIPFDAELIPYKSIIRSAHLKIPIDTSFRENSLQIILNPLSNQISIFENDPYSTLGAPYKVNSTLVDSLYFELSLRVFIQDLVNSRHQNMGFKIVSSSSNNPFSTILLDFKNPNEKVVLEVVYVDN